ncbi:CD209 antigen-like protein D [Anneissia japonica]|uniref:CD209 antigen-like protein D n=1 Tax=Anneissia japonica TaxID=1529436 RepID=UPI00142581C8|nr:CD209 antigen-like protein D [Anneissia japonica]
MTSDWMHWKHSCYISLPDPSKATFDESRKICLDKGADVVVIETEEEHVIINELATPFKEEYDYTCVWIGLVRDITLEFVTDFVWVNGKHPTWTFWNAGEPNGMGYNSHEECTITVPEGWIDITCYWPYAFAICEKGISVLVIVISLSLLLLPLMLLLSL